MRHPADQLALDKAMLTPRVAAKVLIGELKARTPKGITDEVRAKRAFLQAVARVR